ncbi:MAG: efflux RND transporter periplasmic adaptor subunit [Planctomycetes bacterium]|nr:efflux RND transporter periplasmic adaptor subunit [Planctomycetota bacterium]
MPGRHRRARRGPRAHLRLALGLTALTLVQAGCDAAGPAAPAAPAPPRAVRTAVVAAERWEEVVEVTGSLLPRERATVAAEVAGRVRAALVDIGAPVAAGAPLVALDDTDLALEVERAEAALAEARARLGLAGDGPASGDAPGTDEVPVVAVARALLEQAEAEHGRVVALRGQGVASPADLDAAAAALRAARSRLEDARDEVRTRRAVLAQRQAELRAARERLARAQVVAPFDGAVLDRLVAPGDHVQPGAPVARVVSVDPLRVRAEVPERLAGRVRVGQAARVWPEGRTAPLLVTVARVSPALSDPGRALVVEADLPNPGGALRAGAFARLELVVDPEATALVVPPVALRTFAGLHKVLVVEGGAVAERRVTLGRRDAGRIELLHGVAAGERVVLEPGALRAGQPVVAD